MQEIDSKVMSILSELSNLAKNSFGDKLTAVILYGSYARGDYDEYSDVDVMIIADINLSEFSKRQESFVDLCSELSLEYDLVVVPTFVSKKNFYRFHNVLPFYQNVEREGIKIAV